MAGFDFSPGKATPEQAWLAFETKNFDESAKIWTELIATTADALTKARYESDSCYVLCAMKRFDEAREIYSRLHKQFGGTLYLHQLGMVEREAGNFQAALELFAQESDVLPEDMLQRAANRYELGICYLKLKRMTEAERFASECLDLSQKTGDAVMLGCAYRLAADLAEQKGEPEVAIQWLLKSKDCFVAANDVFGIAELEERLKNFT